MPLIHELGAETCLIARSGDARLLSTLVDHVDGVLRVTVGALVHSLQGQPATPPDESVGDWASSRLRPQVRSRGGVHPTWPRSRVAMVEEP
ncbi:hypothetical protein ACWGLE_37505 [Streptomyces sp. NPDC055897]